MTSNVRNQGIAHLGARAGGRPLCNSRRAHIVVAIADAAKWGVVCKRCQAKADKMKPKPALTAATMYALEWSGDVQYFGDETALPDGRFVHLCETTDGSIYLLGTRAAMEAEANEAAAHYAGIENRFRNRYRPVPIPFAGEVPDGAREVAR